MKHSSLHPNIIQQLKNDQVAIAMVATDLGLTFRSVERYLEAAQLDDKTNKAYQSAQEKLTTKAALSSIREALKIDPSQEVLEPGSTEKQTVH